MKVSKKKQKSWDDAFAIIEATDISNLSENSKQIEKKVREAGASQEEINQILKWSVALSSNRGIATVIADSPKTVDFLQRIKKFIIKE